MAGFVGICNNVGPGMEEVVTNAVKATVYSHKTSVESLCSDERLVLGRSFFSFLETTSMRASAEHVQVWVDGEIYNQSSLGKRAGETFADTLLEAYNTDSLEPLLARVDGIYVAILYDTKKKKLLVITDRYGLRPLYLCHARQGLILAAELKCFPSFPVFDVKIRKDVVDCFIALEHFVGNATWFENVEVAAPSSIYTYSYADDKLSVTRYWSWSSIKRSALSLDEAAEAMASLLDQAIRSRAQGKGNVGVALSGGLDSRAILAAVYHNHPVTYTFGIEDSPDVKIARRVARQANVEHRYYDMRVDRWLPRRFSGVWKTDGMLNMYHMHYAHLMEEIPRIMDINLSGFLGDAVLGGTYLDKKGKTFLNERINPSIAQHYYGPYHALCDTNDPFFDLDKVDPYLFYNRGRRMIGLGAEEANKTIPQRLPFMDTRLMDFSYSLSDEYRAHSKVYNKALLLQYPDFYKHIPDASTGVPIGENPKFMQLLNKKFHKVRDAVKFKLGLATSYTDVNNWIKESDTSAFVQQTLDPRNALYANFTSRNFLTEYVQPHLRGNRKLIKQVMGALTFEIWLQQIMNKKFLD